MFLRTLHRKGAALALGSVLALGLAVPAYATAPPRAGRGWIEVALQTWWEGLGGGKAVPSRPDEAAASGGIELERSSGIDPNGRKSRGSAASGSSAGPAPVRLARPTFTCETIR